MLTSGGSPNSRVIVVVMVEEVVVVAPDPSTWRRLLCPDSTVSSATTLGDWNIHKYRVQDFQQKHSMAYKCIAELEYSPPRSNMALRRPV